MKRPEGLPPGAASDKLLELARAHDLSLEFSPEVMAEVAALEAEPGLDDPALEDWRDRPFITIDNEDSRDLDQAMNLRRRNGGGYEVAYALADAAYYVRPETALHAEAMRRGVTYYFPSFAVPMLPRPLSEGLVSLNPNVDRRAFVVVVDLDAHGDVAETRFVRARIRSRAKLSYRGVQAWAEGAPDLEGQEWTDNLRLLREVGELRIARARDADVVQVRRDEVWARVDPSGETFVVEARRRSPVERWNEQISLLCNSEGAVFLERRGKAPWVTPIYRVHPRPLASRVDELAGLAASVVEVHQLDPSRWSWDRVGGESLADYLEKLPLDGPQAGIAEALHRQAVMINQASEFSPEPGEHHGIGAEPYARFSSPMREMVGIHTHKEALEKLAGQAPPGWTEENPASRQAMVELANASKLRQKRIAKEATKLVLDHVLAPDLDLEEEARPVRSGTVLGLASRKIYLRFDDSRFEVKVYVPDLEAAAGSGAHDPPRLRLRDRGARLVASDARLPDIRLGDAFSVRLSGYDRRRRRYRFAWVKG